MGLTGDYESQLKIEAKHEDMCRYNPNFTKDENNYDVVEGNTVELCEEAARQLGEKIHPVKVNLTENKPKVIANMPFAPREALCNQLLTLNHRQKEVEATVEERFQRLESSGSG